MPELPEVETIVRELRPAVMGRMISGMVIRATAQEHLLNNNSMEFYEGSICQEITTVLRKGKYILMPLSNGNVIVFHLGMTGKLLLKESPDLVYEQRFAEIDKHTHFLMELVSVHPEDEPEFELSFNDVRLFGNIWLAEDVQDIENVDVPGLRDLGPDALGVSLEEFAKAMTSKRAIKAVLLDQTKIAGVGNIYADEACFAAKIHPATPASSLTKEELSRLWFSVKSVLKLGIKYRGSSTSDYVTLNGSAGSFQEHHKVYQKTGEKCVECGDGDIQRIKLSGRSTHFCPICQVNGRSQ